MGAPVYTKDRIAEIERLAGTMPVDEMARKIGTSKDALRVWCVRHGVDIKVRPSESSAPQQAHPL